MATYKIISGDTLSQIAQRQKTTVAALMAINPQIKNPNLIYAGQSLNLPVAPVAPVKVPVAPTPAPVIPKAPVAPTPTLASIQAGVTQAQETFKNIQAQAQPLLTPTPTPPVTPSTTGQIKPAIQAGTPTLSVPTAPDTNANYYASSTQQLATAQKALDVERQRQLTAIQTAKTTAQMELDTIRAKQETAITDMGTLAATEKQAKLDQLTAEQTRFDANYNIVQGLASQLTDLMTQGNALIAQQKGITGLAAIREPRIAQTISDVTAAAGVIQASISVYNGQMNQAQSQLTTATNVINSAYNDQLDYYKTLSNFYESKASDTNTKVITLTKDERNFLDDQITTLENKVKTTESNAQKLKDIFLDPDKALKFAKAGITINTPQDQWGTLLDKESYSQEIRDTSNKMALDGASYLAPGQVKPEGAQLLTTTDSKGIQKQWYIPVKKAEIPTTADITEYQYAQTPAGGNFKGTFLEYQALQKAAAPTAENKATAYYQIKQRATQLFSDGMTTDEYKQIQNELITYDLGDYLNDFDKWVSDMGYLIPGASKELGIPSKEKETKLTRESLSNLFGIPDNDEKSGILGGWFGIGKTNKQKLDELVSTVEKYQAVGYSDDEILKMMK